MSDARADKQGINAGASLSHWGRAGGAMQLRMESPFRVEATVEPSRPHALLNSEGVNPHIRRGRDAGRQTPAIPAGSSVRPLWSAPAC
ncbi:hypothetical protein J2855_004401 [Agrobacterium tumefaciens]|jgi:hypothetical protein|uniref:Uncharacterized protein n=2 Tax=Agrobacterium tumefaciens complex TaxID=1183400 RepID=A0AAW8LYD4_AGRTU|nr:hypothetical protein [Agrobacterium radiobacter]MBP2510746.1 hypothetical protein [Agrobacterium tumefaciens]MCP2136464.1 hypothetical protein [Rhizobium sp. SLBN-94]MBB4320057.1 hypothetical protein [Agrobacterium radiobacter]MBB4325283.1 hypothetical protein [Agrobacterium radiobacter]